MIKIKMSIIKVVIAVIIKVIITAATIFATNNVCTVIKIRSIRG